MFSSGFNSTHCEKIEKLITLNNRETGSAGNGTSFC